MELPILKEIFIPKNTKEALWANFASFPWGKFPALLMIDQHPTDYQRYVIDVLIDYFAENDVGPILPYPCYLLSTVRPETVFPFPVFSKKGDIPSYYKQKTKKPHLKETELLEKIQLKLKQFEHTDFFLVKDRIAEYGRSHRLIFLLSQESSFYEHLLKRIKQKNKRASNGQ